MKFADFIAPLDPAAFRAGHYGRLPIHIGAQGRDRPKLLDWKCLNEALAITPYWNEDTLKLFFNSRSAPRENYCDTADLRPGASAPANPAKVRALLGLGASLVANWVHRVSPEVGAAVRMLEQEFAARVFANVYCSFRNVQAFSTHYDLHDVFAVQMEGEKTWRIYEGRADTPVAPLPPGEEAEKWLIASRGRVLFEAAMKPGDVLYLPRGQYHDALTGGAASLHVTFGIQPATGLALFKLLEDALTGESAFRAYLPDARTPEDLQARLAGLADRVRTVMLSPAFATDVLNLQRGLAGTAPGYGLPAQVPPTWYSVVRPVPVVRRDDGYAVDVGERQLALGAAYSAVHWALQQRFFSVEDALARHPAVTGAEFMAVVEQLVRAGVVAPTELQQTPAPR